MNTKVKLALTAILVELSVVALAVLAWKGAPLAHLDALDPHARRTLLGQAVGLLFCPLWLGGTWPWVHRRLTTMSPASSAEYQRWAWLSLLTMALLLVVAQAWIARNLIAGEVLDRQVTARIAIAFLGAWLMAQGNSVAKVAPPIDTDASTSGAWAGAARRTGWITVLVGLVVLGCALVAPFKPAVLILMAGVGVLLANRALLRRAFKAPANRPG